MKRLIIIIACCLLCSSSHAQRADTAQKLYDISKRIFIEPLALIDVYNASSLRIGVEWPVGKNRCAVYGVWGYTPSGPDATYGSYARLGFKFYPYTLFTRKVSPPLYVALNVFYKSQRFSVTDNIETAGNGYGPSVSYLVEKRAEGLNIEVGESHAYKHLCWEYYGGVGVRVSTVSRTIGDSLFSSLYDIREGFINNFGYSNKYNAWLPTIMAGVRVGYLFKSRGRAIVPDAVNKPHKRRQRRRQTF